MAGAPLQPAWPELCRGSRDRPLPEAFRSLLRAVHRHIEGLLAEKLAGSPLRATLQQILDADQTRKREAWPFAFLSLSTAQLVGGAAEAALPAAAAWNLLHLAAKLFDDLEDHHPPTGSGQTWKGLDPPSTINAATALLFLAPLALHAQPGGTVSAQEQSCDGFRAPRLAYALHCTALRMCAGQHRDLTEMANPNPSTALRHGSEPALSPRPLGRLGAGSDGPRPEGLPKEHRFTLDDYWQVAGAKSGSFFAWAARAGAVLGGGTAAQVAACTGYGYNLGVLLQVADDWVDLGAGQEAGDLARGKRTLPVLYALDVAPVEQRKRLVALLNEAPRSPEAEGEAWQAILSLGGLHYLLMQTEIHRRRARAMLWPGAEPEVCDYLISLLDRAFPLPLQSPPVAQNLRVGLRSGVGRPFQASS